MTTIEYFQNECCPRCSEERMGRLGEDVFSVTPLASESGRIVAPRGELLCYVKVCGNCGYVELYSRVLIDRMLAPDLPNSLPGEVVRGPNNEYLVSVFQTYKYNGATVTDFTLPINATEWFELMFALHGLSDTDLVKRVLTGPYKQAWLERVGPIPSDLGQRLRLILQEAEKRYREGSL